MGGCRQVSDAHLAAIARIHDGLIATFGRGRADLDDDVVGHVPTDVCDGLVEPVLAEQESRLEAERVSRLVGELPPAQRDAVYLRHFADLSFAAIARVTGVPLFTAASRYRLGMARLRRKLGVGR